MKQIEDRVFYHIYPFGFCGAPKENDFSSPAGPGLREITGHVKRLAKLGITGLYIGPLFESGSHGYDTLDYFWVDRRLGCNEDLKALVQACHKEDMAVILDGVFNHAGRRFFAFKDLQEKGQSSPYQDWFAGVDFSHRSPLGDPFTYQTWAGHYGLVKYNGANNDLRTHLFSAAEFWIKEFDIDGIRLDAAAELRPDFMDGLAACCKALKPDFWLMGEVVAGDYHSFAHQGRLDSVTNYELYKSLWSSFNEHNFYELSWTLNRQSGTGGLYRDLHLYNFVDNHDVNRIASMLINPDHLPLIYGLLFTLPGVPSIYYGSEYGIEGKRTDWNDRDLRPRWDPAWETKKGPHRGAALGSLFTKFIAIRDTHPSLRRGSFSQLHLSHEQYGFIRETDTESIAVLINAATEPITLVHDKLPGISTQKTWRDLLTGEEFPPSPTGLSIPLPAVSLRILV
ncbi:MAG: alpha-glucosidase C-terminal domain-containing protein [Treponema sp.]|jgi:glycosidase|nr:alpha-glucosidase C-terminal domain-containing protein [Treponema sp.]